jgi:hypothetical protein
MIDTSCDLSSEAPACVVRTIPVGAGPSDLVVSPDGQWLYVMASSGVVEVVGTDGTSVGPSYNIGAASALAISPDGKRVYVAAGQVYVINTDDQSQHSFAPEKEAIDGISNSASSTAVAPDGTIYVGVVTYYFAHAGFSAGGNPPRRRPVRGDHRRHRSVHAARRDRTDPGRQPGVRGHQLHLGRHRLRRRLHPGTLRGGDRRDRPRHRRDHRLRRRRRVVRPSELRRRHRRDAGSKRGLLRHSPHRRR